MFNHWILIGLLSIITYLSRMAGIELMAKRKMSPTVSLYFQYVPVAIISALIIKQIFVPINGELVISLPILVGCLATAIAIRLIKVFLPSVFIGAVIGMVSRYFFG